MHAFICYLKKKKNRILLIVKKTIIERIPTVEKVVSYKNSRRALREIGCRYNRFSQTTGTSAV